MLQEVLGRNQIALWRQHEINGFARRIDGSIQVDPTPGHTHVRLIDAPGTVRAAKVSPDSLVQDGCVALHPAPYRRMVDREAALGHEFPQIAVAEGIAQVPAHTQDDDLVLKMASAEKGQPVIGHAPSAYQTGSA